MVAATVDGNGGERSKRNLLAQVPKSAEALVAARVRMIFAQPDQAQAAEELVHVAKGLRPRFAAVADLLEAARNDILAYMAHHVEHWKQITSTNPLERFHREIGRRTDVVGIFRPVQFSELLREISR